MLNRDISRFLKDNSITTHLWADSAEPKSINEIRAYGHKISGVTKGRDSVIYGINLINQNEIYVTSRSKNLIKELQGYMKILIEVDILFNENNKFFKWW